MKRAMAKKKFEEFKNKLYMQGLIIKAEAKKEKKEKEELLNTKLAEGFNQAQLAKEFNCSEFEVYKLARKYKKLVELNNNNNKGE